MDINKKNRKDLKSYFVKNSIPTESNFADLIDGMLNQNDDGIVKLSSGDPLSIESAGDAAGLQKVINFYAKLKDANPAWSLQLNPRTDPTTQAAGFCVADGATGAPRLFIDKATGNVGIGTIKPVAQLDIAQAGRTDTHPTAIKGLYITGDFGADADGIEFRHSNGSQGIGFGYNTIYAAGSNANQDLNLKPKGTGVMRVVGAANISNGSGYANSQNFMSNGSLTIGGINASYGGGGRGWNANTAGLLLETAANTEIAVHDAYTRLASLMYYEGDAANRITIGRNMGDGVTPVNIAGNLLALGVITPSAGATESNGILFPKDPTGGSGDVAWLRYYARSGEFMTLELGIQNDREDHIALMPSGGVGIGINAPVAKLDISQNRTGTHPTAIKGLYITGDFGADADGIEFRHSNGTQGIGFGYCSIYATGSNTNQDLQLKPKGTGIVRVLGAAEISNGLNVGGRITGNIDYLVSSDNRWKLVMQTDRNLCIYPVAGGAAAWCTMTQVSDISLKKNLTPINNALKNILSLCGFSFDWKDKDMGDNREIGVSAQDVEKIFPELVSTITDRKFVNYNGLIAVLIEAMKEQQTQIDALNAALKI